MNKICGVFLVSICLVLVGSLASAQQFHTYQDPAGRFTLQYPVGWEMGSQDVYGQSILFFLSPLESPQDTFQENVTMIISPLETGQETLEVVESYFIEMSRTEIPDIQTAQTQNLTIANLPAKLSLYTGSVQHYNLAFLVLFIIYNNEAYVIQATSEIDAYQNYQPYFLEILGSFTPATPQFQPLMPQEPQPQLPQVPESQQPMIQPETHSPSLPPLDGQQPGLPLLEEPSAPSGQSLPLLPDLD